MTNEELLANVGFVSDATNPNMSRRAVGEKYGIHESRVRRLRVLAEGGVVETPPNTPETEPVEGALSAKSEETTAGVTFDNVQTTEPLTDWTAVFEQFNLDPKHFIIVDDTVRRSTWQQSKALENGQRDIVNLYSTSARFARIVEGDSKLDLDPVAILAELRDGRTAPPVSIMPTGDASTFCLSINDLQLGQAFNGGSALTIAEFYRNVERARLRIIELRAIGRQLDTLVIVGGGDLGEGCVIYPNQSFSLDLNRKQQSEGVIALLLHAFDTLAPMFKRVIVLAARGNHGENRIGGKLTTLDDNDDTHAFEMAKLALTRDPSMQHIEWTIAESEAGVAVKVYDWVLATTHGDVYAKGVAGATIDKKAHSWMKNMALGRERFGLLGQANVLVGHHFHHDRMSDWGSCLFRQTPSQDRGSLYFEQATGEYSAPGMLTWVMTPDCRWKDESVLR